MGMQEHVNLGGSMFERINVLFRDDCLDKVQFRFPRTKKKRIREKWAKNLKNWKSVPAKNLKILRIIRGGEILAVGHPSVKHKVEELNRFREQWDPIFIVWDSVEDLNKELSK